MSSILLRSKHHKITLLLLGTLLLLLSLYYHFIGNYFVYRLFRSTVSFVFLVYMFYIHRRNTSTLLSTFFILFGSASFLSIWYELPQIPSIMLGLSFLSYVSLILYLKPKIKRKKMTLTYWIIFLVMISINGYLLYQLIDMIMAVDEKNNSYIFMIINAIGMLKLGMVALLYNFTKDTTASLVFTGFVFVLVFSEVFRALGYYDFAYGNVAVYIARFLLVLSSGLLVHYTVINDREKPGAKTSYI